MTLLQLYVSGIVVLFSLFICSYFRLCVYISSVRTPEELLNHQQTCGCSKFSQYVNVLIFLKNVLKKTDLVLIPICKVRVFGGKLNNVHHVEIMKLFQKL